MVAIIDYGMGNVASVQKALNYLKVTSNITADFSSIDKAKYIILPGVGSFMQGMKNLENNGLDTFLTEQVMFKKKKFLGICLGMQLLADTGSEPCENSGLGWVKGSVKKINNPGYRVPHMGWNNIDIKIDKYYKDLPDKNFYFIHSYHFIPQNPDIIAATVNYGMEIIASIQQENIFATQFHPEKSQLAGLSVLKNFLNNA